jgi:hypothetical protein
VVNWEKAPWSLRIYVLITLVGAVATAIFVSSPVVPRLFLVFVVAVFCFFLLRGVRWLWIITVAFVPLDLAIDIIGGNVRWYGVASGIVSLVLLLYRDTRHFFRREVPAVQTGDLAGRITAH